MLKINIVFRVKLDLMGEKLHRKDSKYKHKEEKDNSESADINQRSPHCAKEVIKALPSLC